MQNLHAGHKGWPPRAHAMLLVFSVLTLLLAACSRPATLAPASQAPASQAPASQAPASQAPASQAPAGQATQPGSPVMIDQVQVEQGAGIYVQGHTTLANGECVKTELLDAGQPVDWWPKNVCVQVDAGQWEILAALGKNGAPEVLNPAGHYIVHAWWPKQPQQTSASFSIDLARPTPTQ